MTLTKALTSVAFVAMVSLAAAPADAGQHRGGGRSAGRSSGSNGRSSSGYRGGVVRGGPVRGVVRGGVVRGGYISPRPFYRPYYSFRPRVSLGFGLWMGYPIAYPYYYDVGAYPYPEDPYAYGRAPSGYPPANYPSAEYPEYGSSAEGDPGQRTGPSVDVQRSDQQSSMGGISFEITPDSAAVFVDGDYFGAAADFGPDTQPLGLGGGRRHIELRAPGYRTMTFDADVRSGQVIPVQGTLQRN